MGGNQSIVTISSPSPSRDARHLQQIFSRIGVDTKQDEQDDGIKRGQTEDENECKILLFPTDDLSLFLVPSKEPTRIGWVMHNSTIFDKLCKIQQTQTMKGTTTITLPSQTILIVCSADVADSSQSRRQLAQQLSPPTSRPRGNGNRVNDSASSSSSESPSPSMVQEIVVPRNSIVGTSNDQRAQNSPTTPQKTIIPTIRAELLQKDGQYQPNFPLNSQESIPFETDLFQGRAIAIMRPKVKDDSTELVEQVDPYYHDKIFSKKSRRIILQFQGKFKRKPKGIVFAGAELSDPMNLGLVTKGVASILLSFVEKFSSTVHYSYGDKASNGGNGGDQDDIEKSHIVVPAYTAFETVIITKPGDTPPTLGALHWDGEDKVQEKARKSGKLGYGEWNTTDTYSFGYFSMYIDLPTWSLVKMPIPSGSIGLQTFWGESTLSICMYEKLDEPEGSGAEDNGNDISKKKNKKKTKDTKKHLESLKKYAFSLKVSRLPLFSCRFQHRYQINLILSFFLCLMDTVLDGLSQL